MQGYLGREYPEFPDYVRHESFPVHVTHWEELTLPQLMECWVICEGQKYACHPESPFQPLIDADMRQIAQMIKKKKHERLAG